MPDTGPAVRFSHISMQFPGVLANDDISLDIGRGEIFALVGENGAGKSTLMNILYGLLRPTAGRLFVRGEQIRRFAPAEAIARGIGMVHQHFRLVPSFSVAQNILLSREPRHRALFYDFQEAERIVRALSAEYGLTVDPGARVADLSVGLQQRVEILKTLHQGAELLILDEPTAVLTPQETDELFAVIRRIARERGMTVILITHKLYEVTALSSRVAVMRAGRLVGVTDTGDVTERILAKMMVGSDVDMQMPARREGAGVAAIEASGLEARSDRGLPAVRGVSFRVRRGEILGIAGVEGNGQSELVEAITGLRPISGGSATVFGEPVAGKTPGQIRALGLSHIPEDRYQTGVSEKADCKENLLAGRQREKRFSVKRMHLKRRAVRAYAQELAGAFDIRGAGVDVPSGSLSGGNLQKLVVAREFSLGADALVIAQPTRGVDIGAIEFIHERVLEKRNAGCAILLVSADLDEIFRLSDRIITLYEGHITGEFDARTASREAVGLCMAGGERGADA